MMVVGQQPQQSEKAVSETVRAAETKTDWVKYKNPQSETADKQKPETEQSRAGMFDGALKSTMVETSLALLSVSLRRSAGDEQRSTLGDSGCRKSGTALYPVPSGFGIKPAKLDGFPLRSVAKVQSAV